MEQKQPPIFIDVMGADGYFICQVKYDRKGWPELIDGNVEEVYDSEEIKAFVYKKRPSLRNKNIKLALSKNRVV